MTLTLAFDLEMALRFRSQPYCMLSVIFFKRGYLCQYFFDSKFIYPEKVVGLRQFTESFPATRVFV